MISVRSLVVIACHSIAIPACMAAPDLAANSPAPRTTLVAVPVVDARIDMPVMYRLDASPTEAEEAFVSSNDTRSPASAFSVVSAQSAPDLSRGGTPAKWMMAMSAFGLIAWQLRRKQLSLRSGQLHVATGPQESVVTTVDAIERRPIPSNVVPIKTKSPRSVVATVSL